MEMNDILLGLGWGFLGFVVGYLKGLNDGMEWGLRNIREIHADIKRINDELLRRQDAQ